MGEPGPLPALPLLLRLGVHATAKRLMGSLEAEMETCRVFTFMGFIFMERASTCYSAR